MPMSDHSPDGAPDPKGPVQESMAAIQSLCFKKSSSLINQDMPST